MELKLVVNADGLERKFTVLADSVKQLTPALKVFDRYLRGRIRARFQQEGPGWPALADSTLARRRSQLMAALGRKVSRDVKRTEGAHARRFGALDEFGLGGYERPRAASMRALQRRITTRAEFRRLMAGGSMDLTMFEGASADKQKASLAKRIGRAEAKAGEKVLGKIASSFRSTIRGGTLTVESKIPWAGVHDGGGTAGHGATIPPRPFAYLSSEDVDVLREVLVNRMLLAFEG